MSPRALLGKMRFEGTSKNRGACAAQGCAAIFDHDK
jgi:hypothetical protein